MVRLTGPQLDLHHLLQSLPPSCPSQPQPVLSLVPAIHPHNHTRVPAPSKSSTCIVVGMSPTSRPASKAALLPPSYPSTPPVPSSWCPHFTRTSSTSSRSGLHLHFNTQRLSPPSGIAIVWPEASRQRKHAGPTGLSTPDLFLSIRLMEHAVSLAIFSNI